MPVSARPALIIIGFPQPDDATAHGLRRTVARLEANDRSEPACRPIASDPGSRLCVSVTLHALTHEQERREYSDRRAGACGFRSAQRTNRKGGDLGLVVWMLSAHPAVPPGEVKAVIGAPILV